MSDFLDKLGQSVRGEGDYRAIGKRLDDLIEETIDTVVEQITQKFKESLITRVQHNKFNTCSNGRKHLEGEFFWNFNFAYESRAFETKDYRILELPRFDVCTWMDQRTEALFSFYEAQKSGKELWEQIVVMGFENIKTHSRWNLDRGYSERSIVISWGELRHQRHCFEVKTRLFKKERRYEWEYKWAFSPFAKHFLQKLKQRIESEGVLVKGFDVYAGEERSSERKKMQLSSYDDVYAIKLKASWYKPEYKSVCMKYSVDF